MKHIIAASAASLMFASGVNAACKVNQVTGVWEGTYMHARDATIGLCRLVIKQQQNNGNKLKLGGASWCWDDYGNKTSVLDGRVILDQKTCYAEITFRYGGSDAYIESSYTFDKGVTVAQGLFIVPKTSRAGVITLVKK